MKMFIYNADTPWNNILSVELYMDIIRYRTSALRDEIEQIESNRGRLDHLKDYYKNKVAIVVATGPGFQDYIDLIKDNINDDTIIICIKQSLKCFDHIADFHILNCEHYENYNYNDPKPITLMTSYPGRRARSCADINFFLSNLPGVNHKQVNNWHLCEDSETFMPNDKNIGPGENMAVNWGHIMMETVLPLCVQLGVRVIITNGWVGGFDHGIHIRNPVKQNSRLQGDQENMRKSSERLTKYFKDKYDIDIFTICESQYCIEKISEEKFVDIVNNK
jgi:hypothetical protein